MKWVDEDDTVKYFVYSPGAYDIIIISHFNFFARRSKDQNNLIYINYINILL
jgi:hypothetical protein